MIRPSSFAVETEILTHCHICISAVRNRLYRSGGFFIIAWANHYFPFFLMSRQTFLHHYLPAHLFSALVAGVVTNFVVTEVRILTTITTQMILSTQYQWTEINVKHKNKTQFVFQSINHPVSILGPTTRRRPRMVVTESPKETILLVGISIVILYLSFSFIAPLTYGTPGLDPSQVNRRRLLSTWTLVSRFFYVDCTYP
jgi:dolichyl-phosphate-mannose-protein mannosyltransferase